MQTVKWAAAHQTRTDETALKTPATYNKSRAKLIT
jgi:hypothetical protein